MSPYHEIMSEFAKTGLTANSHLSKAEVTQAVNRLSNANCNCPIFDSEIAQQLWEYTTKSPEGTVLLKDYIQTIIDARNILTKNILKNQEELSYEQNIGKKEELEDCLLSYREDLQILNRTFGVALVPAHRSALEPGLKQSNSLNQDSEFFTAAPSPREESTSLKLVFLLTFMMLLLEIFCMYVRHHFLNILVYISVLSIFFLQYFDGTYIKTLLVMLGLAVGFDVSWLIVHASHYWSPPPQTQYSHLQGGMLGIVYILTIFLLVAKVLVLILLFRFRKNDQKTRKSVIVCGFRAQLNGGVHDNPISLFLSPPPPEGELP